jgi:4-amino-4-deoxy-L-arabinose transferase-like glycosyltransferase
MSPRLPLSHGASVYGSALVILIGVALRFGLLSLDMRFHPDEALFAAQARLISHDVLLRGTDLDKPPLTFYTTALFFRCLGSTEFAARLPNVLFSSLSLALVYALACALYADRLAAAFAALLLALSPYDLAFAATAFTDVQATFWVLVAALAAVKDRWTGAGIAAALMFAAKSNALIMLPLVVALGLAHNAQTDWRFRDILRRLGQFVWPLALGIGLLVLWDLGRSPRSFFELGFERNDPGRFIRSDELWPRLDAWLHWFGWITGSGVLNVFLLMVWAIHELPLHQNEANPGGCLKTSPPAPSAPSGEGKSSRQPSPLHAMERGLRGEIHPLRAANTDRLIAGLALAFLAWHWLIAFNTYDRYIHPLTPFLILLAAHGLVRALGSRLWVMITLMAVIVIAMFPAITQTLRGAAPIGGDQGQHTGIDQLAYYLNRQLDGEIVYDHWLGWELAYYLGEAPQVRVLYSPMPEALADEMARQSQPRYLAAPSPTLAAPWLAALERVGVETTPIYHDTGNGFIVYQLVAQE